MPCYGRPDYLARTLDAWRAVRGVEHVQWMFVTDPHHDPDTMGQVQDLVHGFETGGTMRRLLQPTHRGLNTNLHDALTFGFEHSEFVVLAEDDVVPSADALEFFHWASWDLEDSPVAAVCAFTERVEDAPAERTAWLTDGPGFRPWLWGTWLNRWRYFSQVWDFDDNLGGWDCHLGKDIIPGCAWPWVARPLVSRSDHIGEQGVHMHSDAYAVAQAPTYDPAGEDYGRWTLLPSVS